MKPFLEINRIGFVDDKGKAKNYIQYRGKSTADLDRPLASLILPIIDELSSVVSYRDAKHFKEDVKTLTDALKRLRYVKPEKDGK